MRRANPSLLLPLTLAGIVLASCSSGEPAPQPAPSPVPERIPTDAPEAPLERPTPAPDPLTAAPPAGGVALDAARVDTSGLPPGFPRLVWTRGDDVVGVYGRAGGCTEGHLEVVSQDASRVEVRVTQVRTSPDPCTRELRYPPLEVRLDAPLGERRVMLTGVDASR